MNQGIDCDVKSCKYCDMNACKCALKCIKISNCGKNNTKECTMCINYKKR